MSERTEARISDESPKKGRPDVWEFIREFKWQLAVLWTAVIIGAFYMTTQTRINEAKYDSIVRTEMVRNCSKLANQFDCVNNINRALNGQDRQGK